MGTFESDVFLATEFVEGPTLTDWLKESPHPRAEVLAVFLDAGEGLAAAHRAGLVHRDFKPSNVIVAKDGRVRVLDFGLAKAEHADVSSTPWKPVARDPERSSLVTQPATVVLKSKSKPTDEPTLRPQGSASSLSATSLRPRASNRPPACARRQRASST